MYSYLFYHFFEVFPSIFMNFEQFSIRWYFCQNIHWCNFQYICKIQVSIYLYLLIFSSLSMYRFFFIYISKWEIVLVMPRSSEKSTHNLCMSIYIWEFGLKTTPLDKQICSLALIWNFCSKRPLSLSSFIFY